VTQAVRATRRWEYRRTSVHRLEVCARAERITQLFRRSSQLLIGQGGPVEVNGIPIAYKSFGAANHEPILLIAGTNMQLTDWPPELIDALVRKGYRVVVYDHRDVGLSGRVPAGSQYTVHELAKDAIGLLDHLQIRKANIAGASMDGIVGQIIATDTRTDAVADLSDGGGR